LALAVCCLSGVSVLASAVEYPIKPIQVIVPTGSGGDTDINARIISKYLQKYIGKPVVVTNVTGAGGVIGSRQVKDSAPDGYSVLFFHYGTLTQTLMKKAYFYILDDFEVNGIPLMDNTSVIVTRTGNYKDMTELVADAKARPEQVKYGIETGTVGHLVTYIIQDLAGVKFNIIDTGVAATKNAALLSGQSDVFFATYLAVKSFVDSGDFSLLGLISEQRNPDLPDLKTLKEQGIDFSLAKFFYFAFPKGTPTDAMNIFNDALRKICADPAAKAEFAKFLINLDYIEKDEAHKIIEGTKEKFAKHIDKIM
jgi:tripartite-type tricarboxylate transporter receptor subunit TctC